MRALVHAVRFFFPVLLVAAVVGLVVAVASARPDLQQAKQRVEVSWNGLAPYLDQRYQKLAAADAQLRATAGPVHDLVTNVDAAVAQWQHVSGHGSVADQVEAANALEALSRRLLVTANASPRLASNTAAKTALGTFAGDQTLASTTNFNTLVASYERDRRGPIRRLAAKMLGDGDIPALDTGGSPT